MGEVAILGCGPAGLIAAHAVEQSGHAPVIFSKKVKSDIPGSQYLHEPIPGLTSVYPENTVQYVRMGTARGYAQKVYGDADRYTGWDSYRALYPSWNVIRAYDALWDRFYKCIVHWQMHMSQDVREVMGLYDVVISTLPHKYLCHHAEHKFEGVPYWIKPLPVPEVDKGHDIVIYNGMPEDSWYRYSVLGDRCSIESCSPLRSQRDPDDGWIEGIKAVSNNCDCWPALLRVGRWAKWQHGVLLHSVYHDVKEIMNGR